MNSRFEKYNNFVVHLALFLVLQVACIFVLLFLCMLSIGGATSTDCELTANVSYVIALVLGPALLGILVKQHEPFWLRWIWWNAVISIMNAAVLIRVLLGLKLSHVAIWNFLGSGLIVFNVIYFTRKLWTIKKHNQNLK